VGPCLTHGRAVLQQLIGQVVLSCHHRTPARPLEARTLSRLARQESTAGRVEGADRGVDLAFGVGPDAVCQRAQSAQEDDVVPRLRGRADRDRLAASVGRARDGAGDVVAGLTGGLEVGGQVVDRSAGDHELAEWLRDAFAQPNRRQAHVGQAASTGGEAGRELTARLVEVLC
jgi:hypothetical protein